MPNYCHCVHHVLCTLVNYVTINRTLFPYFASNRSHPLYMAYLKLYYVIPLFDRFLLELFDILYNTLFSREENFAKSEFEIFSREDIFANILFTRKYLSAKISSRENNFPRKYLLAKISSRENIFLRIFSVPQICRLVGLGYAF